MKELIIYLNDVGDLINEAYLKKHFNENYNGTIIRIEKSKCCFLGVIKYTVYYSEDV